MRFLATGNEARLDVLENQMTDVLTRLAVLEGTEENKEKDSGSQTSNVMVLTGIEASEAEDTSIKTLEPDFGISQPQSAASCLTYILNYHGAKELADDDMEKFFSEDAILWPSDISELELVSSPSHDNLDWKKIDRELANNNPSIIFVKAREDAGYYVVLLEKKEGEYWVD